MPGSKQGRPNWLDRLRQKRRERKQRAADRARMRPDVEDVGEISNAALSCPVVAGRQGSVGRRAVKPRDTVVSVPCSAPLAASVVDVNNHGKLGAVCATASWAAGGHP
jgi:hypothetical protein